MTIEEQTYGVLRQLSTELVDEHFTNRVILVGITDAQLMHLKNHKVPFYASTDGWIDISESHIIQVKKLCPNHGVLTPLDKHNYYLEINKG